MEYLDLAEYGISQSMVAILKSTSIDFARHYSNVTIDRSDFESELWIKLLELLPNLGDLPELEKYKYIKACLRNRAYDIVREYIVKGDCSYYRAELTDDIIHSARMFLDMMAEKRINQSEISRGRELLNMLIKIAAKYKGEVAAFIKAALMPSPEIVQIWEQMKEKSPRLRHYEYIPPMTLAKIIGLEVKKVYKIHRIILQEFMNTGYETIYCGYNK